MSDMGDSDFCPPFPINLQEYTIAIVGLGLMGGSLAMALRGKCRKVIGIDLSPETISVALDRNIVDIGTTDLISGIKDAQAVILATPVGTIITLLEYLSTHLPEGCIVMDLGSTKSDITKKMETLPAHVHAIGGHPMCGKEISGIKASDPSIFNKALFILTPLSKSSNYAVNFGKDIAETIGARTLILKPEKHDQLVAMISHLPYLIACGLLATTEKKAKNDPLVWEVAASGFWDTSRLAASDVTMMVDIITTNRFAILDAIENFEASMAGLKKLITASNQNQIRKMLSSIQYLRKTLIPK